MTVNNNQNLSTNGHRERSIADWSVALAKYSLRRFLGRDGYRRVASRKWTSSGLTIGALGLTADLMQVFGSIVEIGLAIAAMSAAVFGFIILKRFRFCASFAVPFMFAALTTLFFGGVVVAKGAASVPDDRGLVATIFDRLDRIDETTRRIETTVNETANDVRSTKQSVESLEARIDEILRERLPENAEINPATREAFETALRDLVMSNSARKQEAVTSLLSGDAEEAARRLEAIAEDQTRSASATAHEASKTWIEIAALKFKSEPQGALDALKQAVRLEPANKTANVMAAGLAYQFGDLEEAFDTTLRLVGGEGDIPVWERNDGQLGIRLAKPPRGVEDPEERRRIIRQIERKEELAVASALVIHAQLYFHRDDSGTALKLLERAERFTRAGRFPALARTIELSRLRYQQRSTASLESAFNDWLAIAESQGSSGSERAAAFAQMAIICARRGDEDDARRYFLEARAYYREMNDALGEASLYRAVGAGIYSAGNRETGCGYLRDAKEKYLTAGGDEWADRLNAVIALGCANSP
ncbi:tetratricopeptide repeat protein [Hyphococcus sp.]|uniref:tetratricopeptide repeat protein n=1 Tax=Hyphococcus sp. TaxID=2038636 RepID=UPI0035C71A0D